MQVSLQLLKVDRLVLVGVKLAEHGFERHARFFDIVEDNLEDVPDFMRV